MQPKYVGIVLVASATGCGVDSTAIKQAYLLGFREIAETPPCDTLNCDDEVAGMNPLAPFMLVRHDIVLTRSDVNSWDIYDTYIGAYQEASYEYCDMPSASQQYGLNRVEAAVLGAEDACVFLSSFHYLSSCEGVAEWAEREVLDGFAGFVNRLASEPATCAELADGLLP